MSQSIIGEIPFHVVWSQLIYTTGGTQRKEERKTAWKKEGREKKERKKEGKKEKRKKERKKERCRKENIKMSWRNVERLRGK